MAQKLAAEILAAAKEEGAAVKNVWIHIKWLTLIKRSHTSDSRKWQEI